MLLVDAHALAHDPKTPRRVERERGQALIELALVLPLFLLLLLGIVQMGSVFRDYIALTDATRVGARQGSIARSLQPPSDRDDAIVARVQKAAVNLDPAKIRVEVSLFDVDGITPMLAPYDEETDWVPSGDVEVRTFYPFKVNLFGLVFFDGELKSRTTERIE